MKFRLTSPRARVAAVALAAAALAPDAQACSCASSGPCVALDDAPVVFVGLVTSVESQGDAHRAHFLVEERVRGIEAATIDVDTSTGTSCGMSFENGVRYLVHAWPEKRQTWEAWGRPFGKPAALTTGYCSGTGRLDDRRDDLDLLHARSQGRPLSRAFGVVRLLDGPGTGGSYPTVPGATVVASGSAGRFEAKTNSEGRYRFDGLPRGSYTLDVLWPTGYRAFMGKPYVAKIEIVPPVCGVERDFAAESDGKK